MDYYYDEDDAFDFDGDFDDTGDYYFDGHFDYDHSDAYCVNPHIDVEGGAFVGDDGVANYDELAAAVGADITGSINSGEFSHSNFYGGVELEVPIEGADDDVIAGDFYEEEGDVIGGGEFEVPIVDDEDDVSIGDFGGEEAARFLARLGYEEDDDEFVLEQLHGIPFNFGQREDDHVNVNVNVASRVQRRETEQLSGSGIGTGNGSEEQRRESDGVRESRIKEVISDLQKKKKKEVTETASSSGSKSDERDNGDGVSCPICMEPWTSDGEHSICCLPCGHLYGTSCIKSWLQQPNSGKCPQCQKVCSVADVRRLYGLAIGIKDKELQEKIDLLEAKCASLELQEAEWRRKEAEWYQREALLVSATETRHQGHEELPARTD